LKGGGILTDLPGYGYAKVPAEVRAQWEGFLSTYLQTRRSLIGMALMMDARHPLTDLDWRMIDWFVPTGRPIHILLTKSDKLARGPAQSMLATVRRQLGETPRTTVQLFSSVTGVGTAEADQVLGEWLRGELSSSHSLEAG
jgi:GTP-binding protein